jgi:hypothetical protein
MTMIPTPTDPRVRQMLEYEQAQRREAKKRYRQLLESEIRGEQTDIAETAAILKAAEVPIEQFPRDLELLKGLQRANAKVAEESPKLPALEAAWNDARVKKDEAEKSFKAAEDAADAAWRAKESQKSRVEIPQGQAANYRKQLQESLGPNLGE